MVAFVIFPVKEEKCTLFEERCFNVQRGGIFTGKIYVPVVHYKQVSCLGDYEVKKDVCVE